ncbi:MAG TPA: hypothetical protein VMH88_06060 [Gemmatimonadales bacterium]|nr:hypothetical protein [Gemmatimonadales bacterium]
MTKRVPLLIVLGGLACGGHNPSTVPEPQTPNAALEQYLAAVKARDQKRMAELWGNEHGSVLNSKPDTVVYKYVAVHLKYLDNRGYRIIDGPTESHTGPHVLVFHVELDLKDGCKHVQQFDVMRTHSGGWMVFDVHTEAKHTPGAPCEKGTG